MTVAAALAVLGAGLVAGAVNTIVGSGSLVTFPTLLAVGLSPVTANVSNTVGLVFGSVTGAVGYRRELAGQLRRALTFGIASLLGGLTGGVLLLMLPGSVFRRVVPALILFSVVLIAVQPRVQKLRRNPAHEHLVGGLVGVYLTGIYGGYFGAAQGVILVGLLGIVLAEQLQRVNALKNVLAAVVNGVAALLFIVVAHVAWVAAGLIAAGSIAGAFLGATLGRRIPENLLRWTIVLAGTAVGSYLLVASL